MIVSPDFFDHWKTRMLAGELGNDDRAPIYVMRLWAHCQRAKRWIFPGLSPSAVKGICQFGGSCEQLWQSLQNCGFLLIDGENVIVHEWEVYNASLVAAWENGVKGGRPPLHKKPTGNPRDTHGQPTGKPIGEDRIGVDKRREEQDIGAVAPSRFVPPMPDEVASYSAKIGYPIDGQGWCDFYAAKGWMVGRVKMKDWRAAARNWKRNRWKPGESVNGSAYPQPPAKKIPLEPANWRELFRIHYPNNEWANDHRDWAQRPSNEQASIISAIRSIPASALREA